MRPIKKKKHIDPRYFLHETADPFGDLDKAPDTDAQPAKYNCKAQPANGEEARALAIAALKAMETAADPFGEMDLLRVYCIRDTRPARSGGGPGTQVTFINGARIVIGDSKWK